MTGPISTAVAAARAPLGAPFAKLWAAATSSNFADGLGRIAIPLIATTLTRDPLLIAALGAATFVPWLVFGLPAGMIVDRADRRGVMALANALRGATALVLALLALSGSLTIWWLLAGALIFGFGETLFDNATNAAIPGVVQRAQLDRANGRIQAAQVTIDTFVAAPIGGLLFAVSLALPLWAGTVGYLVPIALALYLPLSVARPLRDETAPADAPAPGVGMVVVYLWRHRYLRAMVLFTSVVGFAFGFAQAPTLLYFLEEMSVPEAAVGLVMAGIGAGALAGALLAPRFVDRWGRGRVMLATNIVAAVSLAVLGIAPELISAVTAYSVLAFAVATWNVPWGALRQQLIPGEMFGRALGIIRTLTWGLLPIATMLGGWVARTDLRLPYLLSAVICTVATGLAAWLLVGGTRRAGADRG